MLTISGNENKKTNFSTIMPSKSIKVYETIGNSSKIFKSSKNLKLINRDSI